MRRVDVLGTLLLMAVLSPTALAQDAEQDEAEPVATEASEGAGEGEAEPVALVASGEAEPAANAAAPSFLGSFALDPLGFLLFGPTAALEFGAGRWAGAASFRWFDPGLLGKELFLGGANDSFAFSAGGGLRGRYYFDDGFKGAHVGVLFELLQVNVDNSANLTRTKSLYFVPQIEGGYRFAWGRFFVGPSASVGYAAQLSGSVEDLPGGTSAGLYRAADRSSFYGSARLDLGILF